MKRKLINTIAVLAIAAGLVASAVAPWWAVWFVCLPVIYVAALCLISKNTNYIKEV